MQNDCIKLVPSILAADFARLGEQVTDAERSGADRIHVDVMDGHFVRNIAIEAPIGQSLRRVTHLPMETHLMIPDPDFFLDEFAEAGSTSFLVHREGSNNLHRTVQRIKALGKRAGVAINLATSASVLEEILPHLDQLLIMTVNPGFGHQHFWAATLRKIRRAAQRIEQIKPDCELEVDGGTDEATAPMAVAAAANVLVAGTLVFGTDKSVAAAIESLRNAVTQVAQ
jgi:ribulose-phosphate 3-epimerase